jgi:hypothetical protein
MNAVKSYTAPTVTDRGSVLARTLGAHSHATLETGANFRSTSLRTGTPPTDPYGDMHVTVNGTVFSIEKKADGSGRNSGTSVLESVSDLD